MENKIKDLRDIDYKDKDAGTLLFIALTILTVDNFPNNTPDEVINILTEKSAYLFDEEMEQLNK